MLAPNVIYLNGRPLEGGLKSAQRLTAAQL
jgi:hypothetical protein